MAQYGSYQYESTESRALKGITADSYNKDQAKNLIQLNQNSEYMAQYLRKLQKGVDEANQNVIEQIQSFINDIIVLLGGGGATGLDFGDLKYVFMAIGALFGFTNEQGEIQLPVNLFQAAWHFFSSYIMPGAQFEDVINAIIDQAFATLLGLFGDVPVIGEALQQFAVIITDLRDALMPLLNAVETLFNAFGGDWTVGDLGVWTDLFSAVANLFAPLVGPPIEILGQIFQVMATWSLPFIEALTSAVEFVTTLVEGIPLGNIINTPKNVLINPNFDDINSMGSGSGWAWDGTTGKTTNGCAKATPASIARRLDSIAIPVTQGQTISASVWMKWAGLTYTGSYPVEIRIEHFLNAVPVLSPVRIGGQGSPPLNQATWVQAGSTYTIPSGCNTIKLSFYVKNTATNGFVWFDDAELKKTSDGLPQSWIFNLIPDLSSLGDFIQGIVDAIISVIRGIPFVGGVLADLFDDLTDWFDDTQATASIASDALGGVQSTQTMLVQTATQTSDPIPTDPTQADAAVQAALDAQTQTIIATAAQVNAAASASVGQSYSGVNMLEEFNPTFSDGLPDNTLWDSKFLVGSSATAQIKQSDGFAGMEWTAGQSNTEVDQFLHYVGPNKKTITRYQRVTLLVGRAHQQPGFFDGRRATWFVYGRVSPDGNTWVRGYYNCYGGAGIQYKNGAGDTIHDLQIESESSKNAGPATTITLESGYAGAERTYRVIVNGTVVSIKNDSTNLTTVNDTNLEYGWGEKTNGLLPGTINQITANDNKAANVVGSGIRVYRSSTSARNQPINSISPLANNTWDTVPHKTPDIDFDLTTGKVTINTTGWYLFYWRYNWNAHNTTASGERYAGVLLKNIGGTPTGIAAGAFRGAATQLIMEPLDTVPVYVTAGEEFYFGIVTGSIFTAPITGDGDGIYTYAGCALMNNRVAA